MVAIGQVTRDDFAAVMVQQTVLPNPWTYTPAEIARWRAANLEIYPLRLVLEIIEQLGLAHGGITAAYISKWELIRIAIPLAGAQGNAITIANAIASYRRGRLNVADWPDCVPAANDHRLAAEFLRFLANFGLCRRIQGATSWEDQYYVNELSGLPIALPAAGESVFNVNANLAGIVNSARTSQLPSLIERERLTINVLARPGQAQFRQAVLRAYNNRCLLTGDSIASVLEAAHIIPVEFNGADVIENGICLRVDVHRLFDSNNLRIRTTGELVLSEVLRASVNYRHLPRQVVIPRFVRIANIQWREFYT